MSQQNVFRLLKKEKRWMTSKEIAAKLKLMSPNLSLRKLFIHGDIIRRQIRSSSGKCFQYKIK